MEHVEPILLSAFLDEEVTADERKQVEHHLAGCDACRAELQSLRATASLLRLLPEAPLPRTFYVTEAMVAPAPRAAESWWQRLMPRLAPLGAVAAMLLVLVLSAQLFMGGLGAPTATEPDIAASSMATEAPAGEIALEAEGNFDDASDDARVMEEPTEEAEDGPDAAMTLPEATEAAEEPEAAEEGDDAGNAAEPTEAVMEDNVLVDPPAAQPPVISARGNAEGGGSAQPGDGAAGSPAASGPSPLLNIATGLLLLAIFLLALRVLLYRRRAP